MADTFYVVLTTTGAAKIAAATAGGTEVALAEMAVGDSDGVYYDPTGEETDLVNEVYRAALNSVTIDPDHADRIIAELVILASAGGFDIREAGIFDTDGDLIAIAKYPLEHKPAVGEGAGAELTIQLIMVVSNTAVITLVIDPSVVLATRAYVDTMAHELRTMIWFHGA